MLALLLASLASSTPRTIPYCMRSMMAVSRFPPGTPSTLLEVVVDPPAGGPDLLVVAVSHPGIIVSLIQPGNVEVTSANAASLGYEWLIESVRDFRLQSRTQMNATTVCETYTASLKNTGSALDRAYATIHATVPGAVLIRRALVFGDVPANSTTPALNSFSIARSASAPFDPSSLVWRVESKRALGQVTFSDSGAFDARTGDGRYTATFVPAVPGPFQDQAMDDNANGLIDRVVTEAKLRVAAAGNYKFSVVLEAPNGKSIRGSAKAALSAGEAQMSVTFTAEDIVRSLGVNGPFKRINAVLTQESPGGEADTALRADAGTTAAWKLTSFDIVPAADTPSPVSAPRPAATTRAAPSAESNAGGGHHGRRNQLHGASGRFEFRRASDREADSGDIGSACGSAPRNLRQAHRGARRIDGAPERPFLGPTRRVPASIPTEKQHWIRR